VVMEEVMMASLTTFLSKISPSSHEMQSGYHGERLNICTTNCHTSTVQVKLLICERLLLTDIETWKAQS
jgi:hypothetical protein